MAGNYSIFYKRVSGLENCNFEELQVPIQNSIIEKMILKKKIVDKKEFTEIELVFSLSEAEEKKYGEDFFPMIEEAENIMKKLPLFLLHKGFQIDKFIFEELSGENPPRPDAVASGFIVLENQSTQKNIKKLSDTDFIGFEALQTNLDLIYLQKLISIPDQAFRFQSFYEMLLHIDATKKDGQTAPLTQKQLYEFLSKDPFIKKINVNMKNKHFNENKNYVLDDFSYLRNLIAHLDECRVDPDKAESRFEEFLCDYNKRINRDMPKIIQYIMHLIIDNSEQIDERR
ncbi:MAG: hypothetical protein UGF45_04810 [Massilioclostridium sp.]|nr:hypothetical protein [Massilioclostridium sp.]MEE1491339.1 hypothetical protein [Massilioclostridium sp.]